MSQIKYHCPISKSPLVEVGDDFLAEFNSLIPTMNVSHRDGSQVSTSTDGLLYEKNQNILYPVSAGIPQLLPELSIPLEGLNIGKPVD